MVSDHKRIFGTARLGEHALWRHAGVRFGVSIGFVSCPCGHGEAGHKPAGHGVLDYDRYMSLLRKYDFKVPVLLHGLAIRRPAEREVDRWHS